MIIRDERTSVIVPCFCRSLRWRTEQRSTARCGGRDPVRLNNTRQALLLLLLLPYFCPLSTSSCPQPQISTGFILQPTLFLYLLLHFYPSVSPSLLVCTSSPDLLRVRSGLRSHSPGGWTLFSMTHFASLYPTCPPCFVLFLFVFCFTLLYHLLPSTLACICNTHMQEFYLKTILCR